MEGIWRLSETRVGIELLGQLKITKVPKSIGKTTLFEPTCTIDFLYKMKVMMAVLILITKTSEKLEMPSLGKVELNQKIFAQPQWLKIWREQ